MLFSPDDFAHTDSQKIDAIYDMLRRQEGRARFAAITKWVFRLIIIFILGWSYVSIVTNHDSTFERGIQSFITKWLSNIVSPVVNNVIRGNPDLIPQNGSKSSSPDGSPVTHQNVPKSRNITELLKDSDLMKTATDIYNQKTQ